MTFFIASSWQERPIRRRSGLAGGKSFTRTKMLANRAPQITAPAVTATIGEIVDSARAGVAIRRQQGGIWHRRDGKASRR
jgi:hypothetical protein